MQSLLLDNGTWDLVVDANRNLAVCTAPYAVLQDVATAVRIWLGEVLYDVRLGIGYDTDIFTNASNAVVLAREVERIASEVAGVTAAQCTLTRPGQKRRLTGVIRVQLNDGTTSDVQF